MNKIKKCFTDLEDLFDLWKNLSKPMREQDLLFMFRCFYSAKLTYMVLNTFRFMTSYLELNLPHILLGASIKDVKLYKKIYIMKCSDIVKDKSILVRSKIYYEINDNINVLCMYYSDREAYDHVKRLYIDYECEIVKELDLYKTNSFINVHFNTCNHLFKHLFGIDFETDTDERLNLQMTLNRICNQMLVESDKAFKEKSVSDYIWVKDYNKKYEPNFIMC